MSYIAFIVPWLVMMSVIMNSFSHVASSVVLAKFQKTIEEMLISPMPYPVIIAGYVAWGLTRGIMTGTLVLTVAFFFTKLTIASIGLMFFVAILTALLFSLLGLINGLIAEDWDSISIIPNFLLTPLTYLWGIFYSISTLPPVWQKVSQFNPILYIIDAFRYAVHGISDISIFTSISVLFWVCLILFAIVWYMLKKWQGLRT